MNKKSYLAMSIALVMLQACGSDDSSDTVEQAAPTFNLAVSDAPVEQALQVVACFSEVELRATDSNNNRTLVIGADGNSAAANSLCTDNQGNALANTRGIDLLSLSGMNSEQLFEDIEIAAGEYNQIRLVMSDSSYAIVDLDGDGVGDDNDDDGQPDKIPVRVPSNELKLDGFTATLGQTVDLTIEFDLRKGMTNPVGQEGYILKPRGVRVVDNSVSGHIQGTVAESLLLANECPTAPSNLADSVASVYLYSGTGLDAATLADNGGSEGVEALASTGVMYDGAGNYNFEIGFVAAGSYTAALTCDTDSDPEGDDDVSFISIVEASVSEQGQVAQVAFSL